MKGKTPGKSENLFVFLSIFLSLTISTAIAEWVLRYQRQSIETSEQMEQVRINYSVVGWHKALPLPAIH